MQDEDALGTVFVFPLPGSTDHEALDVPLHQPRFHLAHDLVQILEQTFIGRRQDGQTILGLALEGLRLVDPCVGEWGMNEIHVEKERRDDVVPNN